MPALHPSAVGVSFVMPVLNERDYLENAVSSVLRQQVDGPIELVLALGPSSDGTTELAHSLAAADARIVVVDNPAAHIPVGLNRAIRASQHPFIVRVDAHSELSPGYARHAISVLEHTGAANVGGVMRAEGQTPFQRAVAAAYNSRFGLGGGAYHGTGLPGEAESAYLGVMRRSVLDEVGYFDEEIRRGEDWELNLRIREAGHSVWFDPELSVTYWPRDRLSKLARQFRATGAWRAELVRRYGKRNGLRFFAPPLLVLNTVAAVLAWGAVFLCGMRGEVPVWLTALAAVATLPLAAYALLIVVLTVFGNRDLRGAARWWSLLVLPTMHYAWGVGFLRGIIAGAGDTVDASRLGSRNTPLP